MFGMVVMMPCFTYSLLQDDLLRILGERHRLYGFLRTLSVKCSYILFNKEHVKQILVEVAVQKSAGNEQYMSCCMNILVVIFLPHESHLV